MLWNREQLPVPVRAFSALWHDATNTISLVRSFSSGYNTKRWNCTAISDRKSVYRGGHESVNIVSDLEWHSPGSAEVKVMQQPRGITDKEDSSHAKTRSVLTSCCCLCLPRKRRPPSPTPPSTSNAAMVQMFYYENRGKCCKKLLKFNGYPNKVRNLFKHWS